MPTKAYAQFQKNLDTVKRLRDSYDVIREKRASRGKGAFEHFTRSAILFLASAFEVYIEDVTNECCKQNIAQAHDAVNLPHEVRSTLNDYVKRDKTSYSPITLCDEGWRIVYKEMVKEATEKLNTPKVQKITELFKKYIGVTSAEIDALPQIDQLDAFVTFRGEITHRVRATKYVKIEEVEANEELIEEMVKNIDKMLLRFFRAKYPNERAPWNNTY